MGRKVGEHGLSYYEKSEKKPCNKKQYLLLMENLPSNAAHVYQALEIAKYDIYSAARYLAIVTEGKVDIVHNIFQKGNINWRVIQDYYNPFSGVTKKERDRKMKTKKCRKCRGSVLGWLQN